MTKDFYEVDNCLEYAIEKIEKENKEIKVESSSKLKDQVLSNYKENVEIYKLNFDSEMDSFEKAACIIVSIINNNVYFYDNESKKISRNKNLKNEFAIYAGLKIIDNTIKYEENSEFSLEFNLDDFIKKCPIDWQNIKEELIVALYYSNVTRSYPLNITLMLKYLYKSINLSFKLNEETNLINKKYVKKINSIK